LDHPAQRFIPRPRIRLESRPPPQTWMLAITFVCGGRMSRKDGQSFEGGMGAVENEQEEEDIERGRSRPARSGGSAEEGRHNSVRVSRQLHWVLRSPPCCPGGDEPHFPLRRFTALLPTSPLRQPNYHQPALPFAALNAEPRSVPLDCRPLPLPRPLRPLIPSLPPSAPVSSAIAVCCRRLHTLRSQASFVTVPMCCSCRIP
jgi:hypothetical protein